MTNQFERMLLAALVKEQSFLEETIGYIEEDTFQNQYFSYFYTIINTYFKQSKKLISRDIFVHLFKKTFKQKFSMEEAHILVGLVVDIFNTDYDLAFLKRELSEYTRSTKTKRVLTDSLENFEPDKIDNIVRDLTKASKTFDDELPIEYISSIGQREMRDEPISTLIPALDAALDGGIAPGELGFVNAQTGGGKSLLLINFAWAAVIMKRKVLFVTLEDSGDMVLKKFDSMFSGMEFKTLKRNPSKILQLKQRFMKHKNLLYIKDFTSGDCTINKIRSAISRLKGIELIVLDYIDEIGCTKHRGDRWQEVEDSARELKAVAAELRIPIWTASQTAAHSFYKESPDLKDTYGGKGKVHIAHIVLVICQTEEELQNGTLRIKVAKQKSGPKGAMIECRAEFKRMRIFDAQV